MNSLGPLVCIQFNARNVGGTDASVDLFKFRVITSTSEVLRYDAYASASGPTVVPGATSVVTPCFRGLSNSAPFVVKFSHSMARDSTWQIN
jgi:hypothetical protein